MNDDLSILVTLLRLEDMHLYKVALKVPHGLNQFQDWKYFKEPETEERYKEMLSDYNNYEVIDVIELGDVIISKPKNKE